MNLDELLEDLSGPAESYESALAKVPQAPASELLTRLLGKLQSKQLTDSERERRFASVFARVSPSSADLALLAELGSGVDNVVLRNALALLLPPEYKRLVFRTNPPARTKPLIEVALDDVLSLLDRTAVRLSPTPRSHASFSDVIILSISDDPATRKLLESANLLPLRCQSADELDQMLATNEDICAFLVEASFLASMNRDEQRALVEKLAAFSTFVWLRFQEDGLADQNLDVGQLIADVRCRTFQPDVTELSFRDSAGLLQRELPLVARARERLTGGEAHGLFTPGELSPLELKLLGAAMCRYSKERRFNPRAELTQVTTKFLQGGQTGARVALVKVNDLRMPVIVKLDRKEFILDEARRFLTFIYKDNLDLRPEVHLHAATALIVFGIIPSSDAETEEPAPTLEQRLADYWYSEMADPAGCDDGDLLFEGFMDAVRRLAILNKQKCFDRSFSCKANPFLNSLKEMEKKGFDWGFGKQAVAKRQEAENLVSAAAQNAICHGDAHTRNILIRNQQGFLIDYAYSGPGHPCSDLVRLELSVYLTKFIPLGSEDDFAKLQRDLSLERLSLRELGLRHQHLLHARMNRLCLRMCVAARDCAIEVLQAHGLSLDHYLAIKILTAWQSLQIPSLQQFLARSIISAVDS